MEDDRLGKQVREVQDSIHSPVKLTDLNFGAALGALQQGKAIQRAGWNGNGMWLRLQIPDSDSKMTRPYIYLSTTHGDLVPWCPDQADLLATDWRVVSLPNGA